MNRLRELREDVGLSQTEVGDKMGAHNATISKYELGTSQLTADLICKFCDLFDVTSDYLLGRSTQPHSAVSDDEAQLLAAYNAAPANVREGIDAILAAYVEKRSRGADAS